MTKTRVLIERFQEAVVLAFEHNAMTAFGIDLVGHPGILVTVKSKKSENYKDPYRKSFADSLRKSTPIIIYDHDSQLDELKNKLGLADTRLKKKDI